MPETSRVPSQPRLIYTVVVKYKQPVSAKSLKMKVISGSYSLFPFVLWVTVSDRLLLY